MKILISPGYGGGWTTWHCGSTEEKKFMATYQPFIAAIESRPNQITEQEIKDAKEKIKKQERGLLSLIRADIPHMKDLFVLIPQFIDDWHAKFGPDTPTPSFGSLTQAKVVEVDEWPVCIYEHHGFESLRASDNDCTILE
jgi:hypothetical protein